MLGKKTSEVSKEHTIIVRSRIPNLLSALASHIIRKKALKQEVRAPPRIGLPTWL
jgi:hypothetical protein